MDSLGAPDAGPADAGPSSRGGASGGRDAASGVRGRFGAILLGVLAASVVVAVGASGAGLLVPPADLDEGAIRMVRMAGIAAALLGWIGLVVQRRRLRPTGQRSDDPIAGGLLVAGTTMAVLTLIALLAPAPGAPGGSGGPGPEGPGGSTIDPERPGQASTPPAAAAPVTEGFGFDGGGEEPEWRLSEPTAERTGDGGLLGNAGSLLAVAVLLAVAALALRAVRQRTDAREPPPEEAPVAAASAEAGLRTSLDEVAGIGRDPQDQITAAYLKLLSALESAGAPRRAQEAPHEHLRRTLGPLGVPSHPMHRLTELYVLAQFGARPVGAAQRAAAAEALEVSLTSLRARARARGGAGGDRRSTGAPS